MGKKTKPKPRLLRTEKTGFIPLYGGGKEQELQTFAREAGTGSVDRTTINGYRYWRARIWIEDAKGERKRKTVLVKLKQTCSEN